MTIVGPTSVPVTSGHPPAFSVRSALAPMVGHYATSLRFRITPEAGLFWIIAAADMTVA